MANSVTLTPHTVRIVAKRNIQGYYFDLLVQRFYVGVSNMEITTIYSDARDMLHVLQELEDTNQADAGLTLLVGFPYWNSQYRAIEELTNNWVGKICQFSTFGDVFDSTDQCKCYTDEVVSPVGYLENLECLQDLVEMLPYSNADAELVAQFPKAFIQDEKDIIRLVDGYNRYDIQEASGLNSVDLMQLGNFYGERLSSVIQPDETLEEVYAVHHEVILALRRERDFYVKEHARKARVFQTDTTLVCFLYAEEFVNEIAHLLIDLYVKNGRDKVIVFVGKHTKGDDFFSVRSHGVDASAVVKELNNGKGKPTAATVFLGNSAQTTWNALTTALSDIL